MSCAHCAELEQVIADVRQQLAEAGRVVAPRETAAAVDHECERALARWSMTTRSSTTEEAYRAGWAAQGRYVKPQLHEWQGLIRALTREQDWLRSRVGALLTEISRLS